jgi:ParB/RepB/Spo0J family partition protein
VAQAILPSRVDSASDPIPTSGASPETVGPNAAMPINRPAENLREISLASIDPPAFNCRRDFDEADLRALGDSLSDAEGIGMLQPIVVRPRGKRFEVVCGERRYRAAVASGRKTITCTVRELDDRQAAEAQLVENVHRKELNPIELAVACKVLCELGATPDSLASLLGTDERSIDGRLALLSLPDAWQARLRRGEITPAQAEYLVPWADRPQVLAEMEQQIGKDLPLSEWRHRLTAAAMLCTRSMDPVAADGPHFELDDATVDRLDVVKVELQPGRFVKRAFAAAIWDDLQDGADSGATHESPCERPTASRKEAVGRRSAPRRQAKPLRYGDAVAADDEEEFRARVDEWKSAYLRRLCCEAIEATQAEQLCELAATLGVDLAAVWKLRRDFLELFGGGRLEALADELGVDVSMCQGDSERISVLLHANSRRLPSLMHNSLCPLSR